MRLSFPAPIQRVKKPSTKPQPWSAFSLRGVEPESAAVTNQVIEAFNEAEGTQAKGALTMLPFLPEEQREKAIQQMTGGGEGR